MSDRIAYFAFGSNLDRWQMRARCPRALVLGPAVLHNHRLVFAGHSGAWGGSIASVVRAPRHAVEGVLYHVERDELRTLDRFEGVPHSYRRQRRLVVTGEGTRRWAQIYAIPEKRIELSMPHMRYFHVIRRAYDRLGFDTRALVDAAFLELS